MRLIPSDWNKPRASHTDKAPPDNNPRSDTVEGGYSDFEVEGTVFPYRGQEMHGVPVDTDPWQRARVDDASSDHSAELTFDEEPDPVPVYITNRSATEIKSWSATQTRADGNPRELVGRNISRTKVLLRNISPDQTVYIGRATSANYLSGWPLDPGATVELKATDEIHGVCADLSKTALIAVLQEFTVEEN